MREENNRLTDLTRMLLSSQAFSGFLQELSHSGVPAQPQRTSAQPAMQERIQQQPPQQHQHQRKDVNPNDASRQMNHQQPQVGMALMPETNVDLSLFSSSWNSGLNASDFQVFAVTELPADPILDLSNLSEKPTSPYVATKPDVSKTRPSLPDIPAPLKAVRESKPVQTSPSNSLPSAKSVSIASSTSPTIGSDKDLSALCSELEESCERLAAFLPRV